jgi:PAS domain S-box-containing protein
MADPNPAGIYWGECDENGNGVTTIYNESLAQIIGQKHPSLMGQNPKIGQVETWGRTAALLRYGQETGMATLDERQLVLLERHHGSLEEVYFTYKFIPIIGDDEVVIGTSVTITELTREVISDRRIATIQVLGRRISMAHDVKSLWTEVLRGLEQNEKDIPLALLYSVQAEYKIPTDDLKQTVQSMICTLEGGIGVPNVHTAAPFRINLATDAGLALAFRNSLIEGGPKLISISDYDDLSSRLFNSIQWRGFGVPSNNAVVCPIKSNTSERVLGFLFLALNPRQPYNAAYQEFILLLTKQLTMPHATVFFYEEEIRHRQAVANRAVVDRASLAAQLSERTREFEEIEARFSRFAHRAPVGLAIHDTDGTIVYANETWYEITMYPRGRRDALYWLDIVIPEDRAHVSEMWRRLLIEKVAQKWQARVRKPRQSTHSDSRSRSPNHETEVITSVLFSAYVDFDDDGNVKSVMVCVTDVTELTTIEGQLRRRTRALEESESRWKQFADHAPIGLYILDTEGHVDHANESWYSIIGYSPTDISGKSAQPWLAYVLEEDVAKVEAAFYQALHEGTSTVQFRLKRFLEKPQVDGIIKPPAIHRTVLASAYAERNDDGSVRYVIGWAIDISNQMAAEAVLRMRMDEAIELKRQQENFVDVSVSFSLFS